MTGINHVQADHERRVGFLMHLDELRQRLLKSLLVLDIATAFSVFAAGQVFDFLRQLQRRVVTNITQNHPPSGYPLQHLGWFLVNYLTSSYPNGDGSNRIP